MLLCYHYSMENYDCIELIEPTPKLKTKRCQVLAMGIATALFITPFIVALILWYNYDLFIGIVGLGIAYLVVGIIRSKLRTLSIPPHQLEYNYTDSAIAAWFTAKHLCYEEIDRKSSKNPPV